MQIDELRQIIEDGVEGADVTVTGDGRHFEAIVVSEVFSGKPTIQRHRMVYAALGDRFDTDDIHALSLKTYSPDQWRDLRG